MRILRSSVALALLLGATTAYAAGLGKLTVNSSLGEVLNAEIDLVSLQPGELEALTARVAAPEAFRDARIEYTGPLRQLRFAVERRASGQPYLKVTSAAPINEPFVDVLIEVTWPSGRIQREYPILLDPPGYNQAKVTPPTAAATPARAETPPASAPAVASVTPDSSASSASPSGAAASVAPKAGPSARAELPAGKAADSDTYGPVQKGDTLRKIAEETKASGVSLDQMLVALYRENTSAFVGNNMNRLKAGQILKVPSSSEVEKIAKADAGKEIRTHVADWKGYRDQVAGSATTSSTPSSTPNASAGRIGTAAVTPPPSPVATSSDTLKVSKSDVSGKAGPAGAGKGNAAVQEELVAKDKALRESQSRVADLEKQIQTMQRLLDLKGGAPGSKAGDAKVAAVTPVPATTSTKAPEPVKVEPAKVEPAKVEPVKTADATKPADAAKPADATKAPDSTKPADAPKPGDATKPADAAKPADATTVATATPDAPKTDTPKPAAKKAPAPPPKGFMDDITDNPLVLGGIGALALGGIGAVLFMRSRRKRYDDGPSSAMTSAFPSDMKPDSTTGKAGGGLVDTGNSSFLTDFDKTGPGTIDTDEVDPVAEAEVYIAYGRDAQAEEILKEAMARDRGRHEIPLKLLEIYHARKSATAFETVAKELRNSVGDGSPMWQKAAAMGAQIDPTNPLYAAAGSATATFAAMAPAAAAAPAPKPDLDFDLEASQTTTHAMKAVNVGTSAPDFDLDLGTETPPVEHHVEEHKTQDSHTLDFDIAGEAPAMDVSLESPVKDEKQSFDFDLSGLDFPSSTPAKAGAALAHEGTPALDLTDLNLDEPMGGSGEAVGTKLELAKAYLEIGDKDGAREILQEVAREGSAAQKDEAQKLIASL